MHRGNESLEKIETNKAGLKSTFKKRITAYCIVIAILLGYLAIGFVVNLLFSASACPISSIFGIPCPGCGMSRALLYAVTLNFEKAFNMHPLFFLVPIVFLLHSYFYLFKNKNFILNKIVFCVLITALIATYTARMILLFPNTTPMEFNEKSLLGLIIKSFSSK